MASEEQKAPTGHFGRQFAECQIDDCGRTVRSMHSRVLAMKIDSHLQDDHDTTLQEQMEKHDLA